MCRPFGAKKGGPSPRGGATGCRGPPFRGEGAELLVSLRGPGASPAGERRNIKTRQPGTLRRVPLWRVGRVWSGSGGTRVASTHEVSPSAGTSGDANYLLSAVTPGQSSVRNGVRGSPSLL